MCTVSHVFLNSIYWFQYHLKSQFKSMPSLPLPIDLSQFLTIFGYLCNSPANPPIRLQVWLPSLASFLFYSLCWCEFRVLFGCLLRLRVLVKQFWFFGSNSNIRVENSNFFYLIWVYVAFEGRNLVKVVGNLKDLNMKNKLIMEECMWNFVLFQQVVWHFWIFNLLLVEI